MGKTSFKANPRQAKKPADSLSFIGLRTRSKIEASSVYSFGTPKSTQKKVPMTSPAKQKTIKQDDFEFKVPDVPKHFKRRKMMDLGFTKSICKKSTKSEIMQPSVRSARIQSSAN